MSRMNPAREKSEKRINQRVKVSFFLDCNVRLDVPPITTADIEDVSTGGMRVRFKKQQGSQEFAIGAPVHGEIESENLTLQMHFHGTIRWVTEYHDHGETFQRAGIQFADDVVLSEVLYSLREKQA